MTLSAANFCSISCADRINCDENSLFEVLIKGAIAEPIDTFNGPPGVSDVTETQDDATVSHCAPVNPEGQMQKQFAGFPPNPLVPLF